MNRHGLMTAACGLLLGIVSPARADGPPPAPKPTFWVVPHTHWEGAVFKTREEYLDVGLPNILQALRLLEEQPSYRYTLDQVAYVRPFLERYPDKEAAFRRFLAEGRLQVVGGLDVMPDVNMPGGETFVRQMQYGKGYFRAKLGLDVTAGWLIDTFGQHAQMPQLLALAGFKTFWFVRGVPRQEHPTEFFWEGIDGTRIASFYLPQSYALMYPTPTVPAAFRTFARQRFDALNPNTPVVGVDRVGVSAADVSEPEAQQAPLIEAFNKAGDAAFTVRLGIPADYEAVVARRPDRPVFKGELNPIFQGTYSSRIELKAWMRTMEQKLLTAEKLGVLAAWLGTPVRPATTWRAWEPVLFNQTHDLASGVMTDHVYDDTVRSYEFSRRLADEAIDQRWTAVTAAIDTEGAGTPIVVFNTLGWPRSDVAEVDVGFTRGGVLGLSLADETGQDVPAQVVESTRYADGGLKTAKVAFLARDIPSLGYRTYHLGTTATAGATDISARPLENALVRATVDPATGAITGLWLKADGWEALSGPGVVAREADHGDFWELYHGLDGGSRVAMTTRQAVPARGKAAFSDEQKGAGQFVRGPVLAEFRVAHPFGSGRFATRVRVVEGLRRIDVTTTLVNNEKYVRYQALFPTTIEGGTRFDEIPFGAIRRPDAIEFPAQNWVDHGDGRHGLAILNVGLPGQVVTGSTMMVSLLRAHTLGAYGFGGGYEPGMSSETGFQIGQERILHYALVPHAGDWRDAGVFRDGLELNHPLICRTVAPHPGRLPKRWGLLEVSAPGVVVSALDPAPDGDAVLRVYEATGRPAQGVSVRWNAPVAAAREADLLERPGKVLAVSGNAVRLDLHPFEIRTIRLRLGAG
jgi:alpha-mannosidase